MVTSLALWRVLIYLFAVKMTLAKRKTIDIFNDGKGDILQLRTIQRLRYNSIGNKYRNAIFNNSQRKWNVKDAKGNTVIPYVVTGRYDYEELKVIKQAMERIQKNTCIRFRWKHHEVDYIDIQNKRNEGCYTSVGRPGGRSVLMLESNEENTCIEVQIVQHELLHAIGLWHEHMRYDRDRYIKVLYENIRPGYEDQFQKVPQRISTVYGLPYDYKSVMHYGKSAFALPGRISMLTLDPKYTNVIGQQLDASPLDYEKVCKIYGCSHCNGEGENPDGGDETPHPTSKPQPPSPIPKRCWDILPYFCDVVIHETFLDCSVGLIKINCCATCSAMKRRERDSSYGLSEYDDYYD